MAGQVVSQGGRGSPVEQNSYSGCDQGLGGMPQYGLGLLQRHAGKPIDEVREAGTVFQVLKEGSHGESHAPEHPGAADPLGIAFDRRTGRPVNHAPKIVPRPILRKGSNPQFGGRADTRDLPGLGPVQIDPRGGQVLQQLRSSPLVSGSNPVDALTIDIVALLFDAIFQDPNPSAALRAEIARLQIPVLKVALMDKAFFSNTRDPARRLVDGIASAGIGRDESEETRLTEKIRTNVDHMVAGLETNVDIFERQDKALEDFLQEEQLRAKSRTSQVVVEPEEQDRQAPAHARVYARIASRVARRTVPNLVADFLGRHWRPVRAQAFNQAGQQAEPWILAIATMDDLLWSLERKTSPEDRARLLGTLPSLLKRLRTSLEALDITDAWDPFFAQLIRLHVAALRNEAPDPGPQTAKPELPQPEAPVAPAIGPPKEFPAYRVGPQSGFPGVRRDVRKRVRARIHA